MKARVWLAGWVGLGLILAGAPTPSAAASPAPLPKSTNSCSGVWVVVDRGNGQVSTRCATQYRTGLEALASAGFKVTRDQSGAMVQRIHGFPLTPNPASFTNYWSYWHAAPTSAKTFGGWKYSSLGADAYRPVKGSVEGWRFGGGGKIAPAKLPPRGYTKASTPLISGQARKGKRLSVKVGAWSPTPKRIALQWYRSGKAIKKATKSSYKLAKADVGKRITVRVTVSGSGLQTSAKTSKATAKVRK